MLGTWTLWVFEPWLASSAFVGLVRAAMPSDISGMFLSAGIQQHTWWLPNINTKLQIQVAVNMYHSWNSKVPPSIPPTSQDNVQIGLNYGLIWASFWNGGGIKGGT